MAKKKSAAVIAKEENEKWQAEDDVRTLRRAEEIRTDRARLAAAKRVAKEEQAALAKLTKPATRRRATKKKSR